MGLFKLQQSAQRQDTLSRVHFIFATGVAILVIAGVLTAVAVSGHGEDNDWVSHTEEVRLAVAELSSNVHTLAFDSYARLLMPADARPYDSTAMVRTFRALRALTADNPQQQQ